MRSFILIGIAILLLPAIYFIGLPEWVLLIPAAYLAWIFITSSWYAINRTFFKDKEWFIQYINLDIDIIAGFLYSKELFGVTEWILYSSLDLILVM